MSDKLGLLDKIHDLRVRLNAQTDQLRELNLKLNEVSRWLENSQRQNTELESQLDLANTETEYWRQRTLWACRQLVHNTPNFDKALVYGDFTFPDGEIINLTEDTRTCAACGWTIADQCTCETPIPKED